MLTPVVGVVALGGGGGDASGDGFSHGAAPSCPHGKDSIALRPRAPKRTADPAAGSKPPAKTTRRANPDGAGETNHPDSDLVCFLADSGELPSRFLHVLILL